MAKSALRRRRGTKQNANEHALLRTIVCGVLLIGVGLAVGLLAGFFFYSSDPAVSTAIGSPKDAIQQTAQNLRHKMGHPHDFKHGGEQMMDQHQHQEKVNPEEGSAPKGMSEDAGKRKQQFLAYEPKHGYKGPFPYPNDGALVDEHHDFSTFAAPGGYRFEEYKWGDNPYTYAPGESDALARSRRVHVRNAMKHAWGSYEKYAFGDDEMKPISLSGSSTWGNLGITLVDSLDTLWLMDMKEEFYRARDWCKNNLDHNRNSAVSVFETTIRSLGGLLAAYDWSQDEVFLDQAKDLGKRLFKSFDNPTGIPYGRVNLATGKSSNLGWAPRDGILSEFGTLQIEFRTLARWTGIKNYKTQSEEIYHIMHDMNPPNGLYPYFVSNTDGTPDFANQKLTFGAMADSFYEYMLKIWLQGGKTEQFFRDMYDESMQGMFDLLLSVSSPSELLFIADKEGKRIDTKQDHLVCFMGGLLALGAYTDPQGLDSARAQRDLKTAKALTYTCYQTYARMASGISPEYVQYYEGKDFEAGRNGHHFLLRPEAVESFFVLYHLTGDPVYREWGWEVFQAIEKHCRVNGGYGGIRDVRSQHPQADDKMESFFLAETLKYLYLLFDPETPIDLLNKHVFNTEAHPLRMFPVMDEDGVLGLPLEEI